MKEKTNLNFCLIGIAIFIMGFEKLSIHRISSMFQECLNDQVLYFGNAPYAFETRVFLLFRKRIGIGSGWLYLFRVIGCAGAQKKQTATP